MRLKNLLCTGWAAAALYTLVCGCSCAEKETKTVLSENALLIDVRSAEEFRSGHLPGAVNIPHTEISEKISAAAPEKSIPLYLYCRSGRRVGIAMKALKKAGYSTVYNLGGLQEAAKALNLQPTQSK